MRKLGWVLSVLIIASCGFPRPPHIGPDDAGPDDAGSQDAEPGGVSCQLAAIEPSIANANDTITIEGTFVDAVTVNFPGGVSAAATVLGRHRATVGVPVSATQGDLTVTACGSTLGPVPFRRASFALGLGGFAANVEQTASARQAPRFVTARDSHTSVVVGAHLYVLGGSSRDGVLASVEQATINADGSLSQFTTMAGGNLVTARRAHTTMVIGRQLYVIGGFGDAALSSIEHATIGSDGSLGPFVTVSGITLITPRQDHTSVVVGGYLYVIGGLGTGPLKSIERASISADGSLGPFAAVPDTALATPRYGHTAAVSGNYLYVLGGTSGAGSMRDVERATISTDGSLGSFATVSSAFLTTPRTGHTTEVIGRYLYAFFGGVGGSLSVNSVERAPLDADGSLGTFSTVPDATTTLASHGHTTTIVGNYLYALGGSNDFDFLDHGEQASLNISGSLGPFATMSGVKLVTSRAFYAGAVIGNHVFVFGGSGDTRVEQASVNPDGTLGSFATLTDVALTTKRSGLATAIVGSYLYILSGDTAGSVERSTIAVDGSLGPFAVVAGLALVTQRDHTATVIGDKLYVLGGSGANGFLPDVEESTIGPDGSLGAFASLPFIKLATARSEHTSAVVGTYLYVVGGMSAAATELSTLERADIHNGITSFETVPDVSIAATRGLTAAVVGSSLYTVGGSPSVVQRATINTNDTLGAFRTPADGGLVIPRFAPATVAIGNYVYVIGGVFGRAAVTSVDAAQLK